MKISKISKRIKYTCFALLFLLGLSILLYPTLSDAWNQYRNAQLLTTYDTTVNELTDNEYDRLWKEAKRYNKEHPDNTFADVFDEHGKRILSDSYNKVLNVDGDGLMGSVEIPKIQVRIAVYHDLADKLTEKGAAHVEGTSLPVGGKSTHAVIAAHRGLPSAKLFTDLDQLETGDLFYLHILGKTLAYKVDQIKTVLPTDVEALDIIKGEDHVTLLTCTPYGVNTHRLLVRGIRTRYVEPKEEKNETVPQKLAQTDPKKLMAAGLAAFAISVMLFIFIFRYKDKKRKKINKRE